MRKYILSLISILLLLSSLPASALGPRVVRIGAFDYYPAIFKDNDGIIKGFYVDALAEIAKREDIRFEYVYGTWNEGLSRIKSGELDLLTSVAFTPERSKFLDYSSQPLQTVWGELYVPPASPIDGIRQVQGKKIAVMAGDFNGSYFIELVKKFNVSCEFVEMTDFDSIFKAVAAKEVDGGVVNSTFGAAKQYEYGLHSTGIVFNPFDIFFAVAKGKNQGLLSLLDRYLLDWRQQKESPYAKARQKWTYHSVGSVQVIPAWLIYSLSALCGITILSLAFITLLKRQIRRDTADIRESKEVLLASEEKFRSYIDRSPDGIFVTDEHGNFIEVNPAASILTGYPQDELLKLSIARIISRKSLVNTYEYLQRLNKIDFADSEIEFIHKSGEMRWASIGAVKLSATRYLGFAKDITKRRETEEQLLKAMSAAESANTAKSQFLANMSHEIRTPMNGLIGFIELLLGTELTKEQREYAELIHFSGKNLMQLISDILDLSKIEAHKLELESHEFNLHAEIESTTNLLALHAETKGLQLISQIDPDVPPLFKGDAGRLRQILNNIIGNAIKFTASGSVELHIFKDAEDDMHAALRFLVTDTGIGIPTEKLEKIFEPFTQADSSSTRNYGGTGLGLSISRQLVEMMGGTIGVKSIEGQGTTFWFTIPLEKLDETGRALSAAVEGGIHPPPFHGRKSQASLPWGRPIRILLVEDDPINQHMTNLFLIKSGYYVDVANNGREALHLLEENDYSLVLMDCMMPGLSGHETTAIIRNPASAVRDHAVPVIALTANAMREDYACCLAAGMNDYLAKPIEGHRFLATLKKWIPEQIFQNDGEEEVKPSDISGADVFNKGEFISRSLGDIALSRYVATIFIENSPDYFEAIRSALAARDAVTLRQAAHKLKGAAATVALPLLTESSRTLELMAETGKMDEADKLFTELEDRFAQGLDALRDFTA